MTEPKNKSAINLSEMKRFFSYLKGRKLVYWSTLFSAVIFNAVMNVLTAYVNKGVFNAVAGQDLKMLRQISGYGIVLIVISCIYPITRYLHITVVRYLMFEMKVKLFHHMESLDLSYFEKHHSGDSIQRLSNEVDTLKTAYFTEVFVIVSSFVGGVTSLVTMFIYNSYLAAAILGLCLVSINISLRMTRSIRHCSDCIQQETSSLTQLLSDLLAGFSVIKMYRGASLVINRYLKQNENVAQNRLARIKQRSLMEGINFGLVILSNVGIIVVGVFLVLKGYTDYGTVMAIITLQMSVSNLFLNFGRNLSNLQVSMASAARVFEVFDTPVEPDSYPNSPSDNTSNSYIQVNQVSFGYETRRNVLHDLNLTIEKGQKVAFIGPSGGGKSTLIKLLMGFYPIATGSIRIDGKSMGEYSLKKIRDLMGYVPQDTYLFEGTIRENIRYGKPDATDVQIIAAAKAAYAHEFIERLPMGYDTEVLSRGENLSGGQRQRIAIARAFLKNAPILLLDEATSALDSESEAQVQKGLDALMENRTVLIVAHRLTTVEKCDVTYVVRNRGIFIMEEELRLNGNF